ncbi:MAG: addiction module protein [Planctomycetes bacterium]|nr:addiction module protein [Planctomycetota bacterium]
MTQETRELMERVLRLPAEERAALAARLIESLEGEGTSDDDVTRAWREELGRRYDDLVSGRDPGTPAAQALAAMRRAMAEERERRP